MTVSLLPRRKMSVVDTDATYLKQHVRKAEIDQHYEVIPRASLPSTAREAALMVARESDCAIFDHRLDLTFTGADVIAELSTLDFPAILVTQYKEEAIAASRHFLDRLPTILSRGDFYKSNISDLVEMTIHRLSDTKLDHDSFRTFVRVVDIYGDSMDVVVPAWDENIEIRMSVKALPADLRHLIQRDSLLVARVNVKAADQDSLFIKFLRIAPPPVSGNSF